MSASVLTHLADNGVLTITMNRPAVLNSLDESLTLGLVDAMHEAKTDSAVRAVVITVPAVPFARVPTSMREAGQP